MGAGSAISGIVTDGLTDAAAWVGDLLPILAVVAGFAFVTAAIAVIRRIRG